MTLYDVLAKPASFNATSQVSNLLKWFELYTVRSHYSLW